MNDAKYIGLDVHQATISVAVLDSSGKLVMEAILESKAQTILQFLRGLRGSLHVTFEEGTWAASNSGPFRNFYEACVGRGMKPHMARLTLARKIAAITLLVWKKGARFNAEYLKVQAA